MGSVLQERYNYKGKVKKSSRWSIRYRDADGAWKKEAVAETKLGAQKALVAKLEEIEQIKKGRLDPLTKNAGVELEEHLRIWEQILGQTCKPRTVAGRVYNVGHVLRSIGWRRLADFSASGLQLWIAGQRKTRPLPPLDPAQEWFTRPQIAELLGVKLETVSVLMRRHNLREGCEGGGPTRKFTKASVLQVLEARRQGLSNNTANHYLNDLKSFAEWLVQDKRLAENPFQHLRGFNREIEQRRGRQTLTLELMQSIFATAAASTESRYGLTGPQRSLLYVIAASSGFRLSELSLLRVSHVLRDDDGQVWISQPRADSKNKRGAMQPLPADAGELLMQATDGREPLATIWPAGSWVDNGALMIHGDLAAAGLPYVVDGPDGPLYADFHCLRHSFIAMLESSGLSVREQMTLARHSDPKLTIKVYAKAAAQRGSKLAIRKLPAMLPQAPAAQAPARASRGEILAMLQASPEFAAQVAELARQHAGAATLRIAGGVS